MKTNRLSFVLILCFVLFIENFCLAQQNKVNIQNLPQKRAEMLTKKLAAELDLEEKSINYLYQVNLRYELISDSIRKLPVSPEQKDKVFADWALKRRKDYQRILTPAQYHKYSQYIDEMRTQKNANQKQLKPARG